jgi:hypothetical protein
MRIINTSRVWTNEESETRVLLLKLRLEDSGVDEWVFMENEYDFLGQHKGYVVKNLIETDSRFAPYRDRITVLEGSYDSGGIHERNIEARKHKAWNAEYYLKDLAVPYLVDKYKDDDTWIAVVDADEMLDFTDSRRFDTIRRMLNTRDSAIALKMVRYWHDFDNWSHLRGHLLLRLGLIRAANSIVNVHSQDLHHVPPQGQDQLLSFEYSACCDIDQTLRRIQSGPFCYHLKEDLEDAFKCNYWAKARSVGEVPVSPDAKSSDWFEMIELTEENSPTYVREHLAELKTNNIDPNYRENRKIRFPQWFK